MELIEILKFATRRNFTVISISPGVPLEFIQNGKTFYNSDWPGILNKEDSQRLIFSVLYEEQRQLLESTGAVEAPFRVSGLANFLMKARANNGLVCGLVQIFERTS